MENIMSECEEVAGNIKAPRGASLDECLAIVREAMPDETPTIIDNVAYGVWREAHSYPCCCEQCERN